MAMPRTVLVTGAARRLGAVIARHLAGEGWRVAIHHLHSAEDADRLSAALSGSTVLTGDLSDPTVPGALVEAARAAFGGPLTAVVNSASLFDYDTPPQVNAALLRDHYAVNLAAPVLLANALAAQDDLAEGAVVNLLDQKIVNLNPDFFSYTCAKLALAGATTMLAQALGPRIRVNAVSPGLSLPSADQSDAEFAEAARKNLLQRPVDPVDIARAVAFLLEARGVQGQNVFVDCGQRFLPRARDVMFEGRV
ncbi:SDR family oxidoreductase [Sphingomonas echinoides]|uniref:SDR family oxidoreductase n=2 Tax=Sphingomonas echinoides TaxID=59803 RepID=A0ABU4PMX1_9SPHN|nr:SDR family oxidoreductase [Sphingomonas echinoides]MDX5984477.1 SDR family oxidoreductase [Sphingomonas echinoides]